MLHQAAHGATLRAGQKSASVCPGAGSSPGRGSSMACPGIAGSWLFWDPLALLALHLVEGGEDADLGVSPEREAAQGP